MVFLSHLNHIKPPHPLGKQKISMVKCIDPIFPINHMYYSLSKDSGKENPKHHNQMYYYLRMPKKYAFSYCLLPPSYNERDR